jgi:predicted alpha/beta hydrolase
MGNDLRSAAPAADGFELAVTRFSAAGKPWGNVLVANAIGVRQDFYAPFARFLAEQGLNVLTFDYRGTGRSSGERVAEIDTDVLDWARKDLAAMLAEARKASPHLPLALVGHSLGGQIFALAAGSESIRAVLNVAAGVGDYRLNRHLPIRLRLLLFVVYPLLTLMFGYFPGRKIRMLGNLPKRAAWQWRRWCMHPDYVVSEGEWVREALARVEAPILAYSFEDDIYIGKRSVERLNAFYSRARIEHRHLAPGRAAAEAIGHFDYFAERRRDDLWRDALEWLRPHLAHGRSQAQAQPRVHEEIA